MTYEGVQQMAAIAAIGVAPSLAALIRSDWAAGAAILLFAAAVVALVVVAGSSKQSPVSR
jgi:hypothetical protein